MDPLNAYRLAVAELGEVSAARLIGYIARRFGLRLEGRFLPVFRATLRDREGAKPPPPVPTKASPPIAELPEGGRRFQEVRRLAVDLMTQQGLIGWKFAYNRRKQAMGLCVYRRKTIELSIHFVARNPPAEIVDTILHEIAHALVGPGHGHDAVWKRQCVAVGARPQRCGHADMPAGRWQACCPGCDRRFDRHRRPRSLRGWFCKSCGPQRGALVWKQSA
jgi:predicted SprT family Zn-dependent metalloprotease